MENERIVAGMHCGEVLAELSDYLEGDMASDRREQVLGHIQGCDVCERFGGVFTRAIQSLRRSVHKDSEEGLKAFKRLTARLDPVTHREQP